LPPAIPLGKSIFHHRRWFQWIREGTPSPHYARTTCCDRGYGRPSGRPRVFLRQAQDKLTLRRTDKYASGPVPRYRGMVARWHDHLSTISRRRLVHNAGETVEPVKRIRIIQRYGATAETKEMSRWVLWTPTARTGKLTFRAWAYTSSIDACSAAAPHRCHAESQKPSDDQRPVLRIESL
jgi:hypothetical protein